MILGCTKAVSPLQCRGIDSLEEVLVTPQKLPLEFNRGIRWQCGRCAPAAAVAAVVAKFARIGFFAGGHRRREVLRDALLLAAMGRIVSRDERACHTLLSVTSTQFSQP